MEDTKTPRTPKLNGTEARTLEKLSRDTGDRLAKKDNSKLSIDERILQLDTAAAAYSRADQFARVAELRDGERMAAAEEAETEPTVVRHTHTAPLDGGIEVVEAERPDDS